MSGLVSSMFEGSALPALEATLNFAQERHAVLAGNLANLDTPGYHTRDLSVSAFQARLRAALEQRDTGPPGTIVGSAGSEPGDPLREVTRSLNTLLRHDDVNVGLEQQVAEVSKNQFTHNLAITIMTSQFRLLQTAIAEHV